MKPALLLDPAAGRYANGAAPETWYSEEEASDFATRGLLVKKDLHAAWVPEGVVVYADDSFIHPAERNRLSLDPTPLRLHIVSPRRLWLAYVTRDQAMGILCGWGERLLEDAARQLSRLGNGVCRQEEALRAIDSARRARFCTFARVDRIRRREFFRCMAVALMALGQPVESLYADARIDLSDAEVVALKQDVTQSLQGAAPGRHEGL